MQKYEHGYIYYTKATGAHVIEGAIGAKWIAAGAQNSLLGYPKTDIVSGLKNGGAQQTFASGTIVSSPTTGVRITRGAIGTKWIAAGSQNGVLGYPTSDEIAGAKGGSYQKFERGSVYWSSATGAHLTRGGIGSAWAASGAEKGVFGYPITDEIGGLRNGGAYQKFQGGRIYWSPATGVRLTRGAIGSVWASAGAERGYLGYPITNEVGGLKNGGAYQKFERGSIYWSSTTGARIVIGGIRNAWAATGAERGRLGYPTSGEYAYGGGVRQNFQHGYITYTAKRGITIH
jgi:uncharacterized protein with LGFP repeats